MRAKVKFFGPAAQILGARELAIELPDDAANCARLRAELSRQQPRLATLLAAGRFAVNQEFAAEDQPLRANDEVAFIGAVSGG
jgi:molybdopterin converting factor subunit 1